MRHIPNYRKLPSVNKKKLNISILTFDEIYDDVKNVWFDLSDDLIKEICDYYKVSNVTNDIFEKFLQDKLYKEE